MKYVDRGLALLFAASIGLSYAAGAGRGTLAWFAILGAANWLVRARDPRHD